MDLLLNDLSIDGQFNNLSAFRQAIAGLMRLRRVARDFGREIHCHGPFRSVAPVTGMNLPQTLDRLPHSERQALAAWWTKIGPFWDDLRQHDGDDYLDHDGVVVTDTGIGEAAFRMLNGTECGVINARPSSWDFSPIRVSWVRSAETLLDRSVNVDNWRTAEALRQVLEKSEQPIRSWNALKARAEGRCSNLTFADGCFASIYGQPFALSTATRVYALLDILDRFAGSFDEAGERTSEGQHIYQTHFTGDNALFTDASETEKRRFRRRMTFRHPERADETLFCPWHGKERHSVFRIHFSWPIRPDGRVYVMYVGPKLTKR